MIYQPSDDSFLLKESIKKYVKGKSFLDMGSGSGIIAKQALLSGASYVLASDISKEAVSHLKSENINAVHSNLFSNIKNKFDVIAFNPPYLPEDKREDSESKLITTGGKNGDEIVLDFIKQSVHHINKDGLIIILLSSLTPRKRINSLIKELSLSKKTISKKNLFFEELEVIILKNKKV